MSERDERHPDRGGDRDRTGRERQGDDATAVDAGVTSLPMPNEEGTNFRVDRPASDEPEAQGDGDEGRDATPPGGSAVR
jgi:hypothetical protein